MIILHVYISKYTSIHNYVYVYRIILHVYIIILYVYINILHVYTQVKIYVVEWQI